MLLPGYPGEKFPWFEGVWGVGGVEGLKLGWFEAGVGLEPGAANGLELFGVVLKLGSGVVIFPPISDSGLSLSVTVRGKTWARLDS